jgi:(1->4)-alpha-D-glucan 1-alpha-D-glucosylmutase
MPPRIPLATYRIQLTKDFTLRQALASIDYWSALGVTDLYMSPFLAARPGSTHGYDVIDPGRINPEVGDEADLAALHAAIVRRGMGVVMDVVPNHMCVNTNDNAWWNDVLENGPSSPHAKFFDIDWRPPKHELANKVLLPVLGDQYGKILESGELVVREERGGFFVTYYDHRYPVGPGTYPMILVNVLARLTEGGEVPAGLRDELESIITQARRLPGAGETDPERVRERQREKEIIKARLFAWLGSAPIARRALDETLRELNGHKGQPRSFDRLEELLAAQAYRLSFWRVAAEQINYRRFFEINDLAAIRIEEPEVLEAVHGKSFDLLRSGVINGLRIDHVDGLREPRRYLAELEERTGGAYVVVEKILSGDERLPRIWATQGTTGYEFLNILNGVFVARSGERALRSFYNGLRTVPGSFDEIVYESKRLILLTSMASELSVLARRLARISEQHRWSRDFTIGTLQQALADTIACFPVYRTYVGAEDTSVSPQDTAHVRSAIACAQRRNPAITGSVFAFLSDVLLMRDPDGIDDADRAARRDFILRFQQITGPVMAKGLEDTAFYRYFPLLSLNEVGGAPDRFGTTLDEFHRAMEERARERPGALSATSTHDTKRGEDARARLNVLSEVPDEWATAVESWRGVADRMKTRLDGQHAPDADDEYYIYQTLIGAWPFEGDEATEAAFVERAAAAVEKALREGKRNTTWINPNTEYEAAARTFVARALDRNGPLYPELKSFVTRIAPAGMLNGLGQLVLKVTAPGVPDFFQGSEFWDLSLVDPDNRRPIDFERRRRLLGEIGERARLHPANLVAELARDPRDGRLKLLITHLLLAARRSEGELFTHGAYQGLEVEGERREQVVGFLRRWQGKVAVVAVGRYFARLAGDGVVAAARAFAKTSLLLPSELPIARLRDVITGRAVPVEQARVSLAAAFAEVPFAVLIGELSSH